MCLHEDARTDYNDEPGTDLELAKVIIRKCALHVTIKNCTTYLSNKSVKIKPAPGESPQSTNLIEHHPNSPLFTDAKANVSVRPHSSHAISHSPLFTNCRCEGKRSPGISLSSCDRESLFKFSSFTNCRCECEGEEKVSARPQARRRLQEPTCNTTCMVQCTSSVHLARCAS